MAYTKTFNFDEVADADIIAFIKEQDNQSAAARRAFRLLMGIESGQVIPEWAKELAADVKAIRVAMSQVGGKNDTR
jgi:hypothetical protein